MNTYNITTKKQLLEYYRLKKTSSAKFLVDKYIKPSNKSNIELNNFFVDIVVSEYSLKNRMELDDIRNLASKSDMEPEKVIKRINKFVDLKMLHPTNNFEKNIKNLYSSFVKYKNNLKNNSKIHPDTGYRFDIYEQTSFENIEDMLVSLNRFDRTVKYGKSLIKSYKHLFNDELLKKNESYKYTNDEIKILNDFCETIDILNTIKEKKIEREIVESSLSKIASFKDYSDFQNALKQILNSDKPNAQKIIKMIEEQDINVDIVYNENNKLALKINDFEASQALGSSEWCISYNESYYNEYLKRIEDSETYIQLSNEYEDLILETETLENGTHIFYYDFDKNEDDSTSKIAFTLGANSDLTAAFDKNDSSIISEFENIINDKLLTSIAKKSLPYEYSSFNVHYMSSWGNDSEMFSNIYLENRNPIVCINKIVDFLIEENDFLDIKLSEIELNKIYSDQIKYEDISNSIFIDKILKYKSYMDDYNNFMLINHAEDFVDIKSSSLVINNTDFLSIYEKLNDIEKSVIFKKHEKTFEQLKQEQNKIHISYNQENCYNMNNFIKPKHILEYLNLRFKDNEEVNIKDLITKSISFSDIKSSKVINEHLINMVERNEFNINILIENHKLIDEKTLKDIILIVNKLPKDYFNCNMTNSSFHALSESKVILENLSKESISSISKMIELNDNIKIRKNTKYEKDTVYEYPNRMKNLYQLGIINDNIINEKFDMFSGMSMREESILLKETGMNLEGYIKSNNKPNNKSKIKMKIN
jgi:hypothetical protein